ncbi:MAG: hypothetical protein ABSH48_13255 [Verrucomicrobiota bacterium]|jgi:uncharacterized protein YjbJ (UPF0337 family)
MNTLLVKGYWNVAKGKARQKIARWTEDSIEFDEGKRDELTGRIQTSKARGVEKCEVSADDCCKCHRPKK